MGCGLAASARRLVRARAGHAAGHAGAEHAARLRCRATHQPHSSRRRVYHPISGSRAALSHEVATGQQPWLGQRAAPSSFQPSACLVGTARRRCPETPHHPRSSRRHAVHPRSGSRAALCQEVVSVPSPLLSLSTRLVALQSASFQKQSQNPGGTKGPQNITRNGRSWCEGR